MGLCAQSDRSIDFERYEVRPSLEAVMPKDESFQSSGGGNFTLTSNKKNFCIDYNSSQQFPKASAQTIEHAKKSGPLRR